MAISTDTAKLHIAHWVRQLTQPYHPYRAQWPHYLFHHAPLENAVEIICSDSLRSRNDVGPGIKRDVAASEVLASRDDAKNFVRFYFRPGTPTQYHIEGIRRTGELKYGDPTHCPVLVMFVFDAQSILTSPGTRFSDGNMQSHGTTSGDDAQFFQSLPFADIYSVGPCGADIPRRRCAEVLATSPVAPSSHLKAILFRSKAEMDTFLHLLGGQASRWMDMCYVSDALKTFEKRFSFVDMVTLTTTGVGFTLNERADRGKVKVELNISKAEDGECLSSIIYSAMQGKPPTAGHHWSWKTTVPDGEWFVRIHVNDELAYVNKHSLLSELF